MPAGVRVPAVPAGVVIVDLFAGPGGWDEGLRMIDPEVEVVGIESDTDAVTTARAAGHQRRQADVSALDPGQYRGRARGVIASAPCQGFSPAGLQGSRSDLQLILDLLECTAAGEDHRAEYLFEWVDPKSALMVEPLRWVLEADVEWLVMEQVPAALTVFEDYCAHLSELGWVADCGVLRAVDYGVPQDRERAVLVARASGAVTLPARTHTTPVPASTVVGPGLMGFPRRADRPSNRTGSNVVHIDGVKYRARDLRDTSQPAFTVTEKARSWTLYPDGGVPRQITVDEAARLQGFRSGYPWHGTRSRQFLQVANAVPPPLAAAVLREVIR